MKIPVDAEFDFASNGMSIVCTRLLEHVKNRKNNKKITGVVIFTITATLLIFIIMKRSGMQNVGNYKGYKLIYYSIT